MYSLLIIFYIIFHLNVIITNCSIYFECKYDRHSNEINTKYTEEKFTKNYADSKSDNDIPIEILFVQLGLSQNQYSHILKRLLEKIKGYISNKFFVLNPSRPLNLIRSCNSIMTSNELNQEWCHDGCREKSYCNKVEIPEKYLRDCGENDLLNKGEQADLFVFVTSVNCKSINDTLGGFCRTDFNTRRPVAGSLNICPDNKITFDQLFLIVLHQIFHIMGFSESAMPLFNLDNSMPASWNTHNMPKKKTEYPVIIDGITKLILDSKYYKLGLILPKITRHSQQYFNCSTLQYLSMPNGDLNHFDESIIGPELMSRYFDRFSTNISEFTLIFLESTGWYTVNSEDIADFQFSENSGCNLPIEGCSNYYVVKVNNNENPAPFCLAPKKCSANNTAILTCQNIYNSDSKYCPTYQVANEDANCANLPQKYSYNRYPICIEYEIESIIYFGCAFYECTVNVFGDPIFNIYYPNFLFAVSYNYSEIGRFKSAKNSHFNGKILCPDLPKNCYSKTKTKRGFDVNIQQLQLNTQLSILEIMNHTNDTTLFPFTVFTLSTISQPNNTDIPTDTSDFDVTNTTNPYTTTKPPHEYITCPGSNHYAIFIPLIEVILFLLNYALLLIYVGSYCDNG